MTLIRDNALRTFMQTKVEYRDGASAPPLSWRLARRLESLLAAFPPSCLGEWAEAPGGLIVFGDADCQYRPDAFTHQGRKMHGVALLPASTFIDDAGPGVRVLSRLVDHFLGAYFGVPARFITEDLPGVDGWDAFHRQLVSHFQTGYADDEPARQSVPGYFAWAFSRYLLDRQSLGAADPLAYRLLRSTLFSEGYWRGHPRRPRPESDVIL